MQLRFPALSGIVFPKYVPATLIASYSAGIKNEADGQKDEPTIINCVSNV